MVPEQPVAPILHIAVASEWEAAGSSYAPAAFTAEGFVHCSAPHQIAAVADARFAGREDLVVLTIDPAQLTAPVVWEDLADEGQDFPHVYGPIDRGGRARSPALPPRPGRSVPATAVTGRVQPGGDQPDGTSPWSGVPASVARSSAVSRTSGPPPNSTGGSAPTERHAAAGMPRSAR